MTVNETITEEPTEAAEIGEAGQAATAEQLEALKAQLDETRKAQAGSDKKVAELMRALEQKEQEKASVEKTTEQKLAELQQQLRMKEIREMRLTYAAEAGIPEVAKLWDIDTTTPDGVEAFTSALKALIEEQSTKMTQAEIDKRFSNKEKPRAGKQGQAELTYEDILAMTDAEIKALPQSVYEAAVKRTTGG